MAPIPVPLSPRRLAASNLRLHSSEQAFREGSATIVLPKSSTAFLNPVQEFNRDLSVLAIRSWSEMMDEGLRKKWEERRRKMGQNGHNGKKGRKRGAANVEQDGQNREAGALAEAVSTEDAPQDVEPSSDASSKRIKLSNGQSSEASTSAPVEEPSNIAGPSATTISATPAIDKYAYRPFRFTLLEALSATGLRSIRYAREIPLLDKVIANDLSTSAVKAMKRNVALNFPSDRPLEEWMPEVNVQAEQKIRKKELEKKAKGGQTLDEDELMELENARMAIKAANEAEKTSETDGQAADGQAEDVQATASTTAEAATTGPQSDANGLDVEAGEASHAAEAIHPDCKVQINEGDALDVMYSHRNPTKRFQVVDLDPYGTVAPFLDAAVQSVADGGLLCVTSTDCAVLASNNYPEKAFSLYGGSCTRVEYCHEIALRLVLHAISSSAAKYGRYIQPMLSLSIDFYVRLFVRVHTGPSEVKRVASKTGLVYTCSYCQDFHEQRMGRVTETESKNGNINYKFQNGTGPPGTIGAGSSCEECGSRFLVSCRKEGIGEQSILTDDNLSSSFSRLLDPCGSNHSTTSTFAIESWPM
jgi:tRNA (guanine26-N2/guanine27-N2)-dimethyltransferase